MELRANPETMAFRIRIAVFLVSAAVIGLELAMMRILSLRFWNHFAAMVISVALLGFGFSGTLLTLGQARIKSDRRFWLSSLAFAASLSILFSAWAVQRIPLDVHYLAWNLGAEWLQILAIELLMLLPFLLSGGFVGLVLMDHPARIHGHYAANLVGSGLGALVTVPLMFHILTPGLLFVLAGLCYGAGAILTAWKRLGAASAGAGIGILCLAGMVYFPPEIHISPYKKLALERSKPQTRVLETAPSPLGRIDIVEGPALHDAPPGTSLNNPYPIPPRTLVIVDGDQTHIVYDYARRQDWRFLDYTTAAAAFVPDHRARVLVIDPGGGAPLGLAFLKGSQKIDALAADRRMVDLIRRDLAARGGRIYNIPGVDIHFEAPRGYLRRTKALFDLILVPLLDPAAAGGAGLQAAQENYLYTVESLQAFIRHLASDGLLCLTVRAQTPPRDGLRIFNTAVEALKQRKLSAADRLVLIRSWETVTLLVAKVPWTVKRLQHIREFCNSRGFDLCYFPGIQSSDANLFHILAQPYYYEAAMAILGPKRQQYIDRYLFALDAPTDDRPYFDHFIRWRYLPELKRQLRGRMPAFLELGSLLMVIALVQVALIAAPLMFLPLFPGLSALRGIRRRGRSLSYFFLLGIGFMLLEMSFLQKMILYLAQPIYSAAAVIASFLVFAGIGSQLSVRWAGRANFAVMAAACSVAVIGLLYLFRLDAWLAWSQSWELLPRFVVICLSIAPLACAMGHMFPMALRKIAESDPGLIPWSWAVNGFASVLATVSAPLGAMTMGFSTLILAAVACYLAAGALFPFRTENPQHPEKWQGLKLHL